jgi:hypothetical protein
LTSWTVIYTYIRVQCDEMTVHINSTVTSTDELHRLFTALSDAAVITRNGGVLFKSSLTGTDFYLGVVPAFAGGARSYHHIRLAWEDELTFTGFIHTDASMGLLVTPPREEAPPPRETHRHTPHGRETHRQRYVTRLGERYRDTARVFIRYGFPPDFPLDWGTRRTLEEARLSSPAPRTLEQLTAI